MTYCKANLNFREYTLLLIFYNEFVSLSCFVVLMLALYVCVTT